MGKTTVVFFKSEDGTVPAKEWLDAEVAKRDRRALAKIEARIEMLRSEGRDLRRPVADTLRGGIYELRAEFGGVNYRLLYLFAESTVVVVSHGCTKERRVPPGEIDLAIRRKQVYESDPTRHTYEEREQ